MKRAPAATGTRDCAVRPRTSRAVDLLNAERQALEMIVKAAPLRDTLEFLMRVLEAQSPGVLCSVLLLDVEGVRLHHGAAPSLPQDYVRALDGKAVGAATGFFDTVVSQREELVAEDIATEPLWADDRELALRHGLRACRSIPLLDSHGRVLGAFAIYSREARRRDSGHRQILEFATQTATIAITRQREEVALRKATRRLETALEGSQVSIWETDPRTGEVWLDSGWATYLGSGREETLTTAAQLLEGVHPEDRAAITEAVGRAMRGAAGSYEVEHRVRTADGDWKWILSRGRVSERDAKGTALRVSGTNVDITARKHLEQALVRLNAELESRVAASTESLRNARDRLDFLLQASPVIIYSALAHGDYAVTFISDNLRSALGHEPWEFIADAEFWPSHVHPEDRERALARLAALDEGGDHVAEYRFLHKDGTWRWLQDEFRVVRNSLGAPRELVGYLIDVSERRKAAAAIAEVLRLKTQFMTSVTHELRTPLNSVIGFAELLKDGVPGPLNEKQFGFVADIHASGLRLLSLVEGILEMSRLDAGGAALAREPLNIGVALEERVAAHRTAAVARGISMGLDVAPNTGSTALDPKALRRVLDALLDNALKFNRDAGAVKVGARRAGDTLEIAVADTGIGIAPADLPKLFQPLVQLDAALARKYGGIGLGLSMARRLAELQGGSIEVESEPGGGSIFTLRLPLREKK